MEGKDPKQQLRIEVDGKETMVTRAQVQDLIDSLREEYSVKGNTHINIAAVEDLQRWLDEQ